MPNPHSLINFEKKRKNSLFCELLSATNVSFYIFFKQSKVSPERKTTLIHKNALLPQELASTLSSTKCFLLKETQVFGRSQRGYFIWSGLRKYSIIVYTCQLHSVGAELDRVIYFPLNGEKWRGLEKEGYGND